jgi:hypothetical protein
MNKYATKHHTVYSIIIFILMGVLIFASCMLPEPDMEEQDKPNPDDGLNRSIVAFSEDFESGNFSANPWTLGGDANPLVQYSEKHFGTYASKFGTISHNQDSYFQTTIDVDAGSTLTFWYKVSSETNYDFFKFYVDGTAVKSESGEKSWTEFTYDLTEGSHTLKWAYEKDYSVSGGSDTAWIDDIVIESPESGGGDTGGWDDDFETGNFNDNPWTLGGSANPVVQSSTSHNGYYAAKFGTISHNQNSYFEISDVEAIGSNSSITFWYKVSSENRYDFFNFYVNGSRVVHESGNKNWTEYIYDLSEGTYTFKWEYKKDYSVSSGSDTAWVDDIVFITEGTTPVTAPEIEVTGTTDFGDVDLNDTASQTYTIENIGDGDLNLTGSPLVSIGGTNPSQFYVSQQPSTPVAPGSSTTFTVVFDPSSEGTKNATVSIANDDADENPFTFNITGNGVDNTPQPTDGLEDGFETGDFSANPWTLGGDTNPYVQSGTKYGGSYAAQFGTITHDQNSYFEIANIEITEASKLTFWYKVSSEQNYDFFRFYVNGTKVDEYSGTVNWTKYSYDLSAGTYTFKWAYEKDYSVSNGSDTSWIDDIAVVSLADAEPEISISGTTDFGDVVINQSTSKTYTIDNIGEGVLNLTGSPLVAISGTHSSLFDVTSQPSSTINPGDSTTFTITFSPTSLGTKNASVSIANNDADENPFTFNISGNCVDQPSTTDGWLFMMYMDGDNNLNSALWGDVNEMEKGLYDMPSDLRQNVHIIVLWDGSGSYSGGPEHTYLYELGPESYENTSLSSNSITLTDGWFTNGDELDMGNGSNLTQLIQYARDRYPNMENEVLIMSNHGGGVKSNGYPDRYGWSDDTNGGHLYTNEIQQALINAGCSTDKLSMLGMDACLMGVIEEAYEYRNLSEFFVASPETEQGDGWEFNHWMPQMTTSTTPEQLVTKLVQSYKYNFDSSYGSDQTLTAVRLSEMEDLKTAIDYFAEKLYAEGSSSSLKSDISNTANVSISHQRFLGFFCDRVINGSYSTSLENAAHGVKDALGNAVVYAWADTAHNGGYYGTGSTVENGLLIVTDSFYWYTDSSYSSYGYLDFCTSSNDGVVNTWKELVDAWY